MFLTLRHIRGVLYVCRGTSSPEKMHAGLYNAQLWRDRRACRMLNRSTGAVRTLLPVYALGVIEHEARALCSDSSEHTPDVSTRSPVPLCYTWGKSMAGNVSFVP